MNRETYVRQHERSNKKKPGTHRVRGHYRGYGKNDNRIGGSGNDERTLEDVETFDELKYFLFDSSDFMEATYEDKIEVQEDGVFEKGINLEIQDGAYVVTKWSPDYNDTVKVTESEKEAVDRVKEWMKERK